MSLFAQIRAYIDSLVHASARRDPLTAARHRAFIAPRLIGGLLALTALPIHLALSGVPGTLEIFIYAWLADAASWSPAICRAPGDYERAQIMSSVALAVADRDDRRRRPAASRRSPPCGSWSSRSRPRFRPRAAS